MNARERPDDFLLSCVVPAWNEAEGIRAFLAALLEAVAPLAPRVEIVVVNDGSTDATAAEIVAALPLGPIAYVELSRNFGKEAAITAGLEAAAGDAVLVIDADFQHPFETIAPMLARWQAGVDMVYGVRHDRDDEGWVKRWLTRAFYRLVAIGNRVEIPRDAGDFRLMDRAVVDALLALPERNRFMKGLYAWVGFRAEPIEFRVQPRRAGRSGFPLRRLFNLGMTGLTAFSELPLKLVALAGVVVSIGSILYGGYIVVEKVAFGQPIPGFATLAAAQFLLAGVQLIALGVIGEYVARVYAETKDRPLYVVARRLGVRAAPPVRGARPPAVAAADPAARR